MEENLEKDKAALEGAVVESRLQRGFAVNAGNYAAPTSQKENRKSVGPIRKYAEGITGSVK